MQILCNIFWVKYTSHVIQEPIPKMKGHEFNSSDQNELDSVFWRHHIPKNGKLNAMEAKRNLWC